MTAFHVAIPARYASTRLPGKPLRLIAGEPMVVRVARQAERAGAAAGSVAPDDERIVALCEQAGVDALMTSAEHRSGTDRCAEVAAKRGWHERDVVVNVQGDEPLIPPDWIRLAADTLVEAGTDLATLASPLQDEQEFRSEHIVKVVCDGADRALYFSRAPIPYPRGQSGAVPAGAKRHIGLYAYRVDALARVTRLAPCAIEEQESLEQLRALWHGMSITVAVVSGAPAPGIDTEQDIARAEQWLAHQSDSKADT